MGGDINGFQIGAGVGVGADVHMVETNTKEIFTVNILDFIRRLLGGKDECIE